MDEMIDLKEVLRNGAEELVFPIITFLPEFTPIPAYF